MHLSPQINWSLLGSGDQDIDPLVFRLLKAIEQQGSLQSAARSLDISYRYAWGLIKKWETEFNSPLVHLKRGRGSGSHLSELGKKLLWAEQYAEEKTASAFVDVQETLNEVFAEYFQKGQPKKIKIFASHGLAISHLFQLLEEDSSFDIEMQTQGSLDSLKNLQNAYCQVAGFHLPMGQIQKAVQPLFDRCLTEEKQILLTVSSREQGLMVKRGNPKKIHTLRDLTRRSVRFINRQHNSGTRIIVDELLKAGNIRTSQIQGYKNEEFTHAAIAAMIASGAVDTGFGIMAVAKQFQLDFVPFLQEKYLLALDQTLDKKVINKIVAVLKSRKFRNTVNKLAGYDASESGRTCSFDNFTTKS
ncbi:MAG: LysR family transcriptional regulator [Gammaproteobacteria bacterium]|nr:LysR family transcriptional regulator [Gammaproteobacteria bacterium]